MENLTDEQVTTWETAITDVFSNLIHNLMEINNNIVDISNIVKSNDHSLSNSWLKFKDTVGSACDKLNQNNNRLHDNITTFVKNVQSINQEMVSTVDLADNVFKDYIERINSI